MNKTKKTSFHKNFKAFTYVSPLLGIINASIKYLEGKYTTHRLSYIHLFISMSMHLSESPCNLEKGMHAATAFTLIKYAKFGHLLTVMPFMKKM